MIQKLSAADNMLIDGYYNINIQHRSTHRTTVLKPTLCQLGQPCMAIINYYGKQYTLL